MSDDDDTDKVPAEFETILDDLEPAFELLKSAGKKAYEGGGPVIGGLIAGAMVIVTHVIETLGGEFEDEDEERPTKDRPS